MICVYRGNYFDDEIDERLVRVLEATYEDSVSATNYYMVEDLLTGREVEIGDYNLYFEEQVSEENADAWIKSTARLLRR